MTLSILVLFFGFSGEVFRSTVLLSSASQNLCDDASRTDSVLRLLRTDVWNCRSMTLADPRSLELSFSDGTKVSWKIDPNNTVVRTDAAGHDQRWDAIGSGWTFSTDKVSLAISDRSSAPTRLVSQLLLAQSGQP
jgi:hypothetical protein